MSMDTIPVNVPSPEPLRTTDTWPTPSTPWPLRSPATPQSHAPSGTLKPSRQNPLSWNDDMQRAFVEVLVSQKQKGHQAGTGFKERSYNLAIDAIMPYTPISEQPLLNIPRLITKYENLKRVWKAWMTITSLPGWSIDARGLPKSSPQIMDEYYKIHKDARSFRARPLFMQNELYYLFQGHINTKDKTAAVPTQDTPVSRVVMRAEAHEAAAAAAAAAATATVQEVLDPVLDDPMDDMSESDSRKRPSDDSTSDSHRHHKARRREIDDLTVEIRRGIDLIKQGNDLLHAKHQRSPEATLMAAINQFDERYANELAMAKQLTILSALAEKNNALIFLLSTEARQRALMLSWL